VDYGIGIYFFSNIFLGPPRRGLRAGGQLEDAAKEYLSVAESDYANRRTLNDVRVRLRKFERAFAGRTLHEISTAEIEAFLASCGIGSRWSVSKRLRPFFKLAVRRKWVPANPMADIPIQRQRHPREPSIRRGSSKTCYRPPRGST
jgi:hypothetical protein